MTRREFASQQADKNSNPQLSLFSAAETGGISLEQVIEAFYDCLKRKRGTVNAQEFEYDYESNCIDLWKEINNGTYEPRRSIAFVIDHPVKREIFAADFRDRVVHHLIARQIYPLLERQFLVDSYSTQKGKGTLFGIQRVEQHVKDCSEGYTKDCWILKLDISGYFMSIDKQLLYDCIKRFLDDRYKDADKAILLYLLRKTIFNRPEKDCILKVPHWRWKGLPKNKSLFGTDGKKGLPIGNLTSQLLALLFLDELDHLITEQWGVPHYGRYVDDMVLVHESRDYLLEVKEMIEAWLNEHGLKLHPKKVYLQHYTKGVMFVGGMIKPGRKYISKRTVGKMFAKINRFNRMFESGEPVTSEQIDNLMATMNSYLGMMRHYASYNLFHRVLKRMNNHWFKYVYVEQRSGRRYKMAKMDNNIRSLHESLNMVSSYENLSMAA